MAEHEDTITPRRQQPWRHLWWATLVVAVLVRFVLALTSERHLDGDEAVAGLTAKHILLEGERPVMTYGGLTQGGGSIIAYVFAPVFRVFGMTERTQKMTQLGLFAITLFVYLRLLLRACGPGVAGAAGMLWAVPLPAFAIESLKSYGTHGFGVTISVLILSAAVAAIRSRGASLWLCLLTGVFCGLGFWAMPVTLVTTAACGLGWLIIDWRRALGRGVVPWCLGFLLGANPIIRFNLENNFIQLRQFFHGGGGEPMLARAVRVFGELLPAAAGWECRPSAAAAVIGWTAYALAIMLIGWGCVRACREWRCSGRDQGATLNLVLALHSLLFLVALVVTSWDVSIGMYRYIVAFAPACACFGGQALQQAWRRRGWRRSAAVGLYAAWLAVMSVQNVALAASDRSRAGETVTRVLAFLEQRGDTRIYTRFEMGWPLMFRSDEHIIASNINFCRYPAYDIGVRASHATTWVVERDGVYDRKLADFLTARGIGFRTTLLGPLPTRVYYDLACEVRPEDAGIPASVFHWLPPDFQMPPHREPDCLQR